MFHCLRKLCNTKTSKIKKTICKSIYIQENKNILLIPWRINSFHEGFKLCIDIRLISCYLHVYIFLISSSASRFAWPWKSPELLCTYHPLQSIYTHIHNTCKRNSGTRYYNTIIYKLIAWGRRRRWR